MDCPAGIAWTRWPLCRGLAGRNPRNTQAVQNIMIDDLWEFVDSDEERITSFVPNGPLLNSDFFELGELEVHVSDLDPGDWKEALSGQKYQTDANLPACT